MTSSSTISTELVGRKSDGYKIKFTDIVPARNGKLYLVPCNVNKVVSFNPQTNDWNEIGDDLGGYVSKWDGGSLAEDGKIYCNPHQSNDILVIDPSTETTNLIPLSAQIVHGNNDKYSSSAPDQNGNVFFFPFYPTKIMKLNISTNNISILDIHCTIGWRHATLASNGHIYLVSHYSNAEYMMDFDPSNESISKITHSSINKNNLYSKLTEHKDGHIYGISERGIIKRNVDTNELTFVDHELGNGNWNYWGGSIVGRDGCVYALCESNSQIVRYDPLKETTTCTTKTGYNGWNGFLGMSQGSDGQGYCAPSLATQFLKICISRGHWLYLKHRLLIHESRATTHEQDHEGLETVRLFIIGANDDEFSHVMSFV